jgi:NAD(P)-dependent dehydrogenase (short-subunit alcohol dehydrogenase family)
VGLVPLYAVYLGAAAAVEHYSKAASKEFAHRRISVNCVAPVRLEHFRLGPRLPLHAMLPCLLQARRAHCRHARRLPACACAELHVAQTQCWCVAGAHGHVPGLALPGAARGAAGAAP